MELDSSVVHRNLEAKLKILGFELMDLLTILIFAAVMNLLFGRTSLSLVLVFVLPSLLALAFYFGKKGKPDDYLKHLIRYGLLPGGFAAGNRPRNELKMIQRIFYE